MSETCRKLKTRCASGEAVAERHFVASLPTQNLRIFGKCETPK
jgi:hypothetical protein